MKAQHEEVLKKFYALASAGQFVQAFELGAPGISFQVPGKSPLAGKYTRETIVEFQSRLSKVTQGTYQLTVHDVLASDLHGTVLASEKFTINSKTHEFRLVHVWRFENGKPLAGYLYARDLYAFDAAF